MIIPITECGMKLINGWCLGMEMKFHPTLYWTCDYLCMLGLKLNHVSRGRPSWAPHNDEPTLIHIMAGIHHGQEKKKHHWNLNQNTIFFVQENECKNGSHKISAILCLKCWATVMKCEPSHPSMSWHHTGRMLEQQPLAGLLSPRVFFFKKSTKLVNVVILMLHL